MDPNSNAVATDELEFEFFPFIRIYKSGRKERTIEPFFVPAGLDPATDVLSKDVVITPDPAVSARLYLPNSYDKTKNKKLPILIHFHGGGFVLETAFSATYHHYINALVAKSNVVAVSVDYRRCPEHPLPAAYDDSWTATQWVASAADPWLAEHGDYARVFMAGDSAGANISHHMAMRLGVNPGLLRVEGIALIHPYFTCGELSESEGKHRSECLRSWMKALYEMLKGRGWRGEATLAEGREVGEMMDAFWRFLCLETSGSDDPLINPLSERAPSLAGLGCEKVLVFVAERDFMWVWATEYYERLKESGWKGKVEVFETEGESHTFHLFDPYGDRALALMDRLVDFLSTHQ